MNSSLALTTQHKTASRYNHSPPAFLETAKVGPFSLGVNLVKTEGAAALFSGVSATTRMGLYEVPKNKWADPESGKLSLTRKIAGGVVGAAVGNPASGRSMAKQEGVMSSWRGSALTINRAMIVTAAQLASYDQFKEKLVESGLMRDGLGTHAVASFAAGLVASNPVDVIKTRVMNMKAPYYKVLSLLCSLLYVGASQEAAP
ncbi:unnamed protein product [Brassica oleracea]|uniref:(rape) hypothetical protein n=1 Tax=Brassica napus TaxID=3708 RepID=A0A816ND99_BRANA|nr:unnamed protein product [Brassica napus]